MRTNYNSSNQNSVTASNIKDNSSINVSESKVVDSKLTVDTEINMSIEGNVSDGEIKLSTDDKINAYIDMVEVSLKAKEEGKGNTKSSNTDTKNKTTKSNTSKKKSSKKGLICAIIISLIVGFASGFGVFKYVIPNSNSYEKSEVCVNIQSDIDKCYETKDKLNVRDDVDSSVLQTISDTLESKKSDLRDNELKDLSNEINSIQMFITYRSEYAKYISSEFNLEDDSLNAFCSDTLSKVSDYSISGLQRTVISEITNLILLKDKYLSTKTSLLSIQDVSSYDESSYQEYIDNMSYIVNKGYLQALSNKLVAEREVVKATDAYDKASKAGKQEAKKVLDSAIEVKDKAVSELNKYNAMFVGN